MADLAQYRDIGHLRMAWSPIGEWIKVVHLNLSKDEWVVSARLELDTVEAKGLTPAHLARTRASGRSGDIGPLLSGPIAVAARMTCAAASILFRATANPLIWIKENRHLFDILGAS